jgi:hypothetical protein
MVLRGAREIRDRHRVIDPGLDERELGLGQLQGGVAHLELHREAGVEPLPREREPLLRHPQVVRRERDLPPARLRERARVGDLLRHPVHVPLRRRAGAPGAALGALHGRGGAAPFEQVPRGDELDARGVVA